MDSSSNSQARLAVLPRTAANPAAITIIVALIGLAVTLAFWRISLHQIHETNEARFDRLVDDIREVITTRLSTHAQGLGGIGGLFQASKSVERGEFRAYVRALQLDKYPGSLGFGFTRFVSEQDLAAFLAQTRADEAPDFTIRSLGPAQADHFINEYIEPLARNLPAQGLDLATETQRRETAIRAVAEDRPILTRRITLVQDEKRIPGFLLLQPVYHNQTPTDTLALRWQNLMGWVYTPIRIDGLMAYIVDQTNPLVDFEVFDEAGSFRSALLYDANNLLGGTTGETITDADFATRLFHRQFDIGFGGRVWHIHVSTRPEFISGTDQQLPWVILFGGLGGTALLTYIVNTSRRVQKRALTLAETMTVELREEIAQRQSAENARRAAARFQETMLNSAGYAIISTTPEGVIRVFNPAAQRMLGYAEAEVVGRQGLALFHDSTEVVQRAREFSAELGCPVEPGFDVFVVKSCRNLPNEHEWTYVRKDGSRFPVLLSISAIRDDADNFSGFLSVAVDITERKRALTEILAARLRSDEALHEVQALRDAMDQHSIVSVTDLRGVIQYVNDRFVAISGYSRQELIGRTHQIVNSGQHPPIFWQEFWQTITSGQVWRGEICNRAKAGSTYWVAATVVPFRNAEGEIDRFVSIRTEITNRINAETELIQARQAADAASKSKSDFLAEMSHEIRTPMNAVLGFTDLLAETSLNERQRKFVETIQTSGKSLLCIINDILDYSKIEAGKLTVECLPCNVIPECETVVGTLGFQAKAKQLTLELRPSSPLLRPAVADPTRVRQVLLNLVSNALKFTRQGGVTLSLEPLSNGTESFIRISVADTGIGLTPEQQGRLFTRYNQATQTTTREFGGTGLGLAICKRLVELMGGQIGVISKIGQGSTFWFTLPLSPTPLPATSQLAHAQPTAPDTDRKAASAQNPSAAPTVRRLHVLVADDNPINQQLACAFLSRLSCTSATAQDGEEAARLATTKQFDLVLMDYQMPNLNGMEATTAIRHWEDNIHRADRIPIYALTANHDPEIKRNFLASGMNGVLSKPLILADLAEVIHELRTNGAVTVSPSASSDTIAAVAGSQSPPPSSTSAMDRTRALELTDHNPMLLGMLAQAFLAQSDGLQSSIQDAFKARDPKALKAHAHKLKGSLSVFAANRASATVLALNKFHEPADWTHLEQLHQELQAELARLKPELAALSTATPAKP